MTTNDLDVRVSATAVVTDAMGVVKSTPAPASGWDESMRYYRQAQLDEDVFASTRNLWLALENILDSVSPKSDCENEEKWLKRALKAADAQIGLKSYLPAGSSKAPHNAAYSYLYEDARTHLFHAKASRRPLLPHEEQGTNLLAERHERMTLLYLALLEAKTGVRRASGVMTYAGFEDRTRHLATAPQVQVTDDPVVPDPDQTTLNPAGGTLSTFSASRASQLERPGLKIFTSTAPSPKHQVTKLGFLSDSVLTVIEGLFDLTLNDTVVFETQIGFRLSNLSSPRAFSEF